MAEVVDRTADILDTVTWHLVQVRLATAFAVVGGVVGQRDKALLGKALGIIARGLFFNATEGTGANDRGNLFAQVKVSRCKLINVNTG